MRMIEKTLAASAIAALMALPLAAQDANNDAGVGVDAGISAGISFENGIAVDLGGGLNVDTDPSSVPEGLGEGYQVAADGNMVGKAVVSSDGQTVGTVTNEYTGQDLQTIVRIEAADGVELGESSAFYYPLAADADTDGELQLPMTVAELQTEVAAQTGAN